MTNSSTARLRCKVNHAELPLVPPTLPKDLRAGKGRRAVALQADLIT
jgi:hypothetical protein